MWPPICNLPRLTEGARLSVENGKVQNVRAHFFENGKVQNRRVRFLENGKVQNWRARSFKPGGKPRRRTRVPQLLNVNPLCDTTNHL